MKTKNQLSRALEYAESDLRVLPLHSVNTDGHCTCSEGAKCTRPGKHPRTARGVHDATTDQRQIKQWWEKWPDANIGIATGQVSGIIVFDIDPRNGGLKTLRKVDLTPATAFEGKNRAR